MEYIMETLGSGVAWLDYDQDGLMDLFIVQGSSFPTPSPALHPWKKTAPTCKLFKNLGSGRFRDVTAEAGLDGCGLGVAIGDIDNDGFPDLFLTCYGKPNVLYHNVSDGLSTSLRQRVSAIIPIGKIGRISAPAPLSWTSITTVISISSSVAMSKSTSIIIPSASARAAVVDFPARPISSSRRAACCFEIIVTALSRT
jgi:hypothetical protein